MRTIILLTISNVFMNLAWYGHLRFKNSPIWIAILASWGIRVLRIHISGAGKSHRL